ncbi:glycosyltransferase family 2 protein [Embleya sp. NPDC050493]|uniref:glycosyltransferase family 2 protein n=1 Tax=Embleya sp. NPDC050493 TaxID=3363989 RepID=UPI0037B71A19
MMPYYGDVGLMQHAVRSILAQTDPNWRLTVVDDGREKGVPEWFAALGDDRVRYRRNEHNLGVTENFRKCVDLAELGHMVMMGCDDVLLPNYIATIRAVLRAHPDAGMVQPGVQVIDGAGLPAKTLVDQTKRRIYAPKIEGVRRLGGERLAISVLRGNWLYFPSVCWRTEAIQAINFRRDLHVIQDLALVLDLLQAGEQLVVSDVVCFQYRRHAVSESSLQAFDGRRFVEERGFFLDVADRMEQHGWHEAAKVARKHFSSRLHALTMLPMMVRSRNWDGARMLARHTYGTGRHAG